MTGPREGLAGPLQASSPRIAAGGSQAPRNIRKAPVEGCTASQEQGTPAGLGVGRPPGGARPLQAGGQGRVERIAGWRPSERRSSACRGWGSVRGGCGLSPQGRTGRAVGEPARSSSRGHRAVTGALGGSGTGSEPHFRKTLLPRASGQGRPGGNSLQRLLMERCWSRPVCPMTGFQARPPSVPVPQGAGTGGGKRLGGAWGQPDRVPRPARGGRALDRRDGEAVSVPLPGPPAPEPQADPRAGSRVH